MDKQISRKVLVVDDEPNVRKLVREILIKDYVVLEAQDGEEAVSMAHNSGPDIILMDLMMPRMDGLTACSAIKKDHSTKEIPVVMLTAIGYSLNRRLAENAAGVSAYVTKPFDSYELLATISKLLHARDQTTSNTGNAAHTVFEKV